MEAIDDMTAKGIVGKRLTILSIDGGGIRGVIPATILKFFEEQLQILDGTNVHIADYFDVIAGTSTGGLIGAMLSVPNEEGRPRYKAKNILNFYQEDGPKIFPRRFAPIITQLLGPKFSPKALEKALIENLKDLRIKDTVTELIIPTFDIKLMEPIFFSTSEAKKDELKNAYIRDVLRGTSAAPTYFPPHFFTTTSSTGETKTFNLVDGGVGANNPAYLSIIHTLYELSSSEGKNASYSSHAASTIREDYTNILILSLGTGLSVKSYSAKDAAKWGILSWVLKDGHSPIIDIVTEASADVVDYNLSVLFSTLQCPQNYLRIQALNLPQDVTQIDDGTSANITRLKDFGEKLLDLPVTTQNIVRGTNLANFDRGTYKEALIRFAKELSSEYRARKLASKEPSH